MSDTAERLDSPKLIREQMRFFELVRSGVRPLHAAHELGWSPAKLRKMMRDRDFADLAATAEEMVDESVEQSLYAAATKGNVRAQQFWLLNRRSDKWRDVRHLEVQSTHQLDVQQIEGVKAGVLAALQQGGVRSLRAATDTEPPVVEAEVVDTSTHH